MNDIAQIISTIGFPIVSFLLCGYFVKYTYDKQAEKDKLIEERDDIKWQKLGDLTSAVNNNSEILRQLVQEVHKNETDSKF